MNVVEVYFWEYVILKWKRNYENFLWIFVFIKFGLLDVFCLRDDVSKI